MQRWQRAGGACNTLHCWEKRQGDLGEQSATGPAFFAVCLLILYSRYAWLRLFLATRLPVMAEGAGPAGGAALRCAALRCAALCCIAAQPPPSGTLIAHTTAAAHTGLLLTVTLRVGVPWVLSRACIAETNHTPAQFSQNCIHCTHAFRRAHASLGMPFRGPAPQQQLAARSATPPLVPV